MPDKYIITVDRQRAVRRGGQARTLVEFTIAQYEGEQQIGTDEQGEPVMVSVYTGLVSGSNDCPAGTDVTLDLLRQWARDIAPDGVTL